MSKAIKMKCYSCGKFVSSEDVWTHCCSDQYERWRKPFLPRGLAKVVFVGLAPPRPKDQKSSEIKYIYKDPRSPLKGTSLRLRNVLEKAFRLEPTLNEMYRPLSLYFNEKSTDLKRSFLMALKQSGVVWIDTVEFPVRNRRVYRLLECEDFSCTLADRILQLKSDRVILLSDFHEKVSRLLKGESSISRRFLTVGLLPSNFWALNHHVLSKKLADALAT